MHIGAKAYYYQIVIEKHQCNWFQLVASKCNCYGGSIDSTRVSIPVLPKVARELAAYEIKRKTKPGLHAVGGVAGLCLRVKDSGARSWILRTNFDGKRREYGLGGFPTVSLAQARERAQQFREQIWAEVDPIADRAERAAQRRSEQAKALTFDEAATLCHNKKIPEFRNPKHKRDWISSLDLITGAIRQSGNRKKCRLRRSRCRMS